MNKSLRLATMAREQPPTAASDVARTGVHIPYAQDAFERWVLFLDTLRERADNMIAHERQGMPPLLDFDYELVRDTRKFERPANYALLRITRVGNDCWDDCVDAAKPPVIIIDPRAGTGRASAGSSATARSGWRCTRAIRSIS